MVRVDTADSHWPAALVVSLQRLVRPCNCLLAGQLPMGAFTRTQGTCVEIRGV
jgi:hypothetical protein